MEQPTFKTPWAKSMGNVPMHLSYFHGTICEAVLLRAKKHPQGIAMDYFGTRICYRSLAAQIVLCAKAFKALGIRENDTVTIALPNCPQAIIALYAANRIGAIVSLLHPLSAQTQIEDFLKLSGSVAVITLDQLYSKFSAAISNTKVKNLILTSIVDPLSFPAKVCYWFTQGFPAEKIPKNAHVLRWNAFLRLHKRYPGKEKVKRSSQDPAVILCSGGTTGTAKGVVLSNSSFNALGQQIIAANPMFRPGDKMLSAMPIFHGFGLGVCIHTMLMHGGRCILLPRLTPKQFAKSLWKHRCNFIAGVPTLYAALLQLPNIEGKDLSCLKGVFCGGDTLSSQLQQCINQFLRQHKANVHIREGYGATETVTACCLMPWHQSKDGSIGIPLPDTYIKIVSPGTDMALPYGQTGEILISGPTCMLEYLCCPEETAQTLRTHADTLTWVYTGDLGAMDEDGFVYFKGRSKRMIVTSGYNVYPAQLENALNAHELVQMSCVIGVPDPYKMQKIKAFVKLIPSAQPNEETKQQLWEHCRKHIAKYAMPYAIEFREDLPKTLVGKVAYRILEEEEISKMPPENQ